MFSMCLEEIENITISEISDKFKTILAKITKLYLRQFMEANTYF